MTIDEFVVALDEAMTELRLRPAADTGNYLRLYKSREDGCGTHGFCPITAVALHRTGRFFRMDGFPDAADLIGLGRTWAFEIVEAADGHRGEIRNYDELRGRLEAVINRPRIGL